MAVTFTNPIPMGESDLERAARKSFTVTMSCVLDTSCYFVRPTCIYLL